MFNLIVINKSDINKSVINRKKNSHVKHALIHIVGYKDNDNVFKYRSLLY